MFGGGAVEAGDLGWRPGHLIVWCPCHRSSREGNGRDSVLLQTTQMYGTQVEAAVEEGS